MGCNPVQFVLWLIILIFISFIVGFFCAPLYVIVHCLSSFLPPLSDISDLLLKGAQFPRFCAEKMMQYFRTVLIAAMRNIEIKASIRDSDALKSKAKELSGKEGTILRQTDTFFKVPKGRLKFRQFKNASGELIFYERPDTAGPKLSTYKKTDVTEANCQGLCEVLAESNGVLGIVEKTRYLYLVGQSRIHVDDVLNLGTFAEIEVVLRDDETIEDGQKIINNLMEELGIKSDELISTAYLDLILAKTHSTNI